MSTSSLPETKPGAGTDIERLKLASKELLDIQEDVADEDQRCVIGWAVHYFNDALVELDQHRSRVAQQQRLPEKLTGELACILEDCSPPDKQTPEAIAALIEGYQPTWDKLRAALATPAAPPVDTKPIVWMMPEHVDAYRKGSADGIAWASPTKTDSYTVALYTTPPSPAQPGARQALEFARTDLTFYTDPFAWNAEDEAYEIGKRDGYESAVQDIDLATGGDGEFKGSTILGGSVDVPVMKARVIARLQGFASLPQPGEANKCPQCQGDGYINVHENLPDVACPSCSAPTSPALDPVTVEALTKRIETAMNEWENDQEAPETETCAQHIAIAIRALSVQPPGNTEPVAWQTELDEAIGHLGACCIQFVDSDDRIIREHVQAAHEILKIVRRKA